MVIGHLAASTSQLIYGYSVAGFGFSLGRGIFQGVKKSWQLVVLAVVLAGAILLPIMSSSKVARWYPIGFSGWLFKKLLLWSFVSLVGLGLVVLIVIMFAQSPIVLAEMKAFLFTADLINQKQAEFEIAIVMSVLLWLGLTLIGLIHGTVLRGKRKLAHELEKHNQNFLNEQGIKEVASSGTFTHVDPSGEKLRFNAIGPELAEFFVVGRRNKRAYLMMDEQGRFTQYTGIVSL